MFEKFAAAGVSARKSVALAVAGALSAAGLGLAVAATQPAAGLGPYDGKWTVDASTSSMLCPVRQKQFTAIVLGGKVLQIWGLPGNPSGSGVVQPNGGVAMQVHIKLLGVTAHINGKVNGKTAEGAWSADSILCPKGSWRAAIVGPLA
jgi:hypothetical protein